MAGYRRRGRGHRSRSQSRHPLRKTRRTGHSRSRRHSTRPRATARGSPIIVRRPPRRRIHHEEEEEPEDELDDLGEIPEPVDNYELYSQSP